MRYFYSAESDCLMDDEYESEAEINSMLDSGIVDEITEKRFHELRKELKMYWNEDSERLFERFKRLGSGVEREIESVTSMSAIIQNSQWISASQIKDTKRLFELRKKSISEQVELMFEDMDELLIDIVDNLNKTNKEKLERIKEL